MQMVVDFEETLKNSCEYDMVFIDLVCALKLAPNVKLLKFMDCILFYLYTRKNSLFCFATIVSLIRAPEKGLSLHLLDRSGCQQVLYMGVCKCLKLYDTKILQQQ